MDHACLPPFPHLPTCKQMRDYFDMHCLAGREDANAFLDQRGLGFIQPKHHGNIALGIPPEGETHDDATGRVFVRGKY